MPAFVKKLLAWTFIVLILLLALVRLSVPYGIQLGFSDFFEQQGLSGQIGDVDLSLIDGELTLLALSVYEGEEQHLAVQRLSLRWSWSELLDDHARLVSLYVDGLDLKASEDQGVMTVAGLASPAQAEPAATEETESSPPPWRASIGDVRLQRSRVCYAASTGTRLDHCISIGEIDWNGDIRVDLSAMAAEALPLSVDGDFRIGDLELRDNRLDRSAVSFGALSIEGIAVDTPLDVRIDRIGLEALALLQRQDEQPSSHITSLSSLSVDTVTLSELSALTIDTIAVRDHELLVLKREDGSLEFDEWIPASTDEPAVDEDAPAASQSDPMLIRLGNFDYQSETGITYTDNSLPDAFTARLSSITLAVSDIDTSDTQGASRIDYAAVFDDHGKITLAGDATLFAPKKTIAIDGDIRGMDLREISAFTKGTIGYSIKSGQLDSDISLRAEDNILDSKLVLNLHQFELKALSKEDEEKMNSSMGLPLSSSLSLLRDSDNSIRLEIPITGDVDAPDFDPADAINKALSKAITFAVVNYYTPFGLVMAADGLLSLATGLNFDPVAFDDGSAEIGETAGEQLDTTLSLLTERPGIRLTLCGFSSSGDAAGLVKDRKPQVDGSLPELTAAQKAPLLELAEQRSAAIKQYLIEREVAADRLILCAPEHDPDSEAGRVDISI